jgi:adenine-specific DNA-methyltransferase
MPFLDWVNKNQALGQAKEIPYHLFQSEASYGKDSENLLIQGDNLFALKALRPLYEGQIKCVFIDPPYNTKGAFEQYDDKLEHSQWLSMMYPRLSLLRDLLAEDGSIWISLDNSEAHYFKVLADEIFGRSNYLGDLIWKKRKGGGNDSHFFAVDHDYIIAYAKNASKSLHPKKWRVSQTDEYLKRYKEVASDGRRYYWDTLARDGLQNPIKLSLQCPDGSILEINSQKSEATVNDGLKNGDIRISKIKGKWSIHHRVYMPQDGQVLRSILDDVGTNKTSSDEISELFNGKIEFDYPKPENLISKILELTTAPGDLVLDSFLGSGTTAAVAHKMNRKWIGIEMGEHAKTHCMPRLQKVIEGEQGGISKNVGWEGGGGFHFCKLAAPMFNENGQINGEVKFKNLAHFLWNYETKTPAPKKYDTPLLGTHNGVAYYLLYNGILGDKRPESGNVLTSAVLKAINEIIPHDGPKVIYGEACRLGQNRLDSAQITFKQIPYDIQTI